MRHVALTALLAVVVPLLVPLRSPEGPPPGPAPGIDPRPNLVLILMDDFSTELLRTMPQALRMKREGAWYRRAYVSDSLCCPSRAALLTGRLPHQTGVLLNSTSSASFPIGGFAAFVANGNPDLAFNVTLRRSGYTTGFVGKYLNGYNSTWTGGQVVAPPAVPGWSVWNAQLEGAYSGWGFRSTWLDRRGSVRLTYHPRPPADASSGEKDAAYATKVSEDLAVAFLDRHRDDQQPYFLEVATYAPHASLTRAYPGDPAFPPAFRDRASATSDGNCGAVACDELSVRDLTGYGDPADDNRPTYLLSGGRTRTAPAWRTAPVTLTRARAVAQLRHRAQMVQAIDRLIARVRRHVGPNTYVVLTSDNGFHLGQHHLNGGKGTPYDSDTRVPLLVVGPGVVPGPRDRFVSNIDLAPTFLDLAGLPVPDRVSGLSFATSLRDPSASGRRFAFIEHTWSGSEPGEVDADLRVGGALDVIPSYVAVRSSRGLLVRFDLDNTWTGHRYAWELYRYDRPYEDVNVFAADRAAPYARELRQRLLAFTGCTPAGCRAAAR